MGKKEPRFGIEIGHGNGKGFWVLRWGYKMSRIIEAIIQYILNLVTQNFNSPFTIYQNLVVLFCVQMVESTNGSNKGKVTVKNKGKTIINDQSTPRNTNQNMRQISSSEFIGSA